jgi:hypothetical protein
MSRYKSYNFAIFLTKSIIKFSFTQVPNIDDSILMASHDVLLNLLIILS